MYLDEEGNFISDMSKVGAMAVGVPGTVAGIFAAHEKLGSLPIEEILAPVIELANNGYVVTENQQKRLEQVAAIFEEVNQESSIYTQKPKAGDTIKNLALGATLSRISKNGRSEFYNGETAKKLVDFMKSKGGIITLEDLSLIHI